MEHEGTGFVVADPLFHAGHSSLDDAGIANLVVPTRTLYICYGSLERTSESLAGLGRIAHPTPFESVSSGEPSLVYAWPLLSRPMHTDMRSQPR